MRKCLKSIYTNENDFTHLRYLGQNEDISLMKWEHLKMVIENMPKNTLES